MKTFAIDSGADYMREIGSLLAHLGVPKPRRLKIFFVLYDVKIYPVHKETLSGAEIAFYFLRFQRLVL